MTYGNSGPLTVEDWLALERFDYARVGEHWAVLRLLAGVGAEHSAPGQAKLIVERDLGAGTYPARACALERRVNSGTGRVPSSGLLWRASFALPLETLNHRGVSFALAADGCASIPLPAPVPRIIDRQTLLLGRSPYSAAPHRKLQLGNVKQRAAALATAVAVTTASTPAIGLAASSTPHAAVSTRPHGWGTAAGGGWSAASQAAAKAAATTDPSTAAPASAPRGLGSSPAVGANGQPCLPNDSQPTLADPQPTTAATGAALPACAPPAKPRRGTPAKPRHKTPPATPRRATKSGTSHPASNLPKPGKPVPGPASGANGGSALTTSPTTAPPTTAPPTTPPPTTVPPTTTPPTSAPPAQPVGPSTLGPAPSTLAPPASTRVRTQPRSAAPTSPSRASKPDSHAIHSKRPTGGAPLELGGLTHRPPVKLPTAAPGTGTLSPGFTGPQSWAGTVNASSEFSGALSNLSELLVNGNRPPAFLIPIYMEAGKRYHVPWEVLAAINSIETNYGRNLNTSSAGAIGWMQFMPATWKQWGVAIDGHSVANPYDPRDAIYSAARYLEASGAATNVAGAVFSYNHASWYVTEVLSRARAIAAGVHYTAAHYTAAHSKRNVLKVEVQDKLFKHGAAWFNGGLLTHYDRLLAAANMVSAANFPYVFGGGHEQPAQFGPFDCSGAVSYIVQQAGYTVPTTVSGAIPSWNFPAGPGKVTIFYNAGHTFMRIGDRYFGTSGFARPGGGAGWFDTNKLPASYLATFQEVHLPNLHDNSLERLASLARPSGN